MRDGPRAAHLGARGEVRNGSVRPSLSGLAVGKRSASSRHVTRRRRACASGATRVACAVARFARETGAGSGGLFPLEGVEAALAVAFSVVVCGTLVGRRRRGFADVLGVCALGWGFGTRGGVRFVEWTSHGTPALPRSTLMFLRAGRVCCGGYTACASRFGGAALFGGSLDDVKRSTRSCWTGSLVGGPCLRESLRRVLFFGAACCGFALRYDMWAAGSPLEERVYRGAGRSRRRARGDGVLVWSGVALPCLCGGSFLGLVFREGEGATFSLGRSLARSACV